jgi:hypothetical protein
MSLFIPTFLYIKQHSVTGLMYFGKTIKNPETYLGSGKRWLNHIKKHGTEHVVNLWYCLFLDDETLSEFANQFSASNNITESVLWANLMPENGHSGGPVKNNNFITWNKLPKSADIKLKISTTIKSRNPKTLWRGKPITIGDTTYPSITAAAKHFGKSDAGIHYWISIGKALRPA